MYIPKAFYIFFHVREYLFPTEAQWSLRATVLHLHQDNDWFSVVITLTSILALVRLEVTEEL